MRGVSPGQLRAPRAATPVLGGLLSARRPLNPIGWLLLATALANGYSRFAHGWGYYGLVAHPGSLPAAEDSGKDSARADHASQEARQAPGGRAVGPT